MTLALQAVTPQLVWQADDMCNGATSHTAGNVVPIIYLHRIYLCDAVQPPKLLVMHCTVFV